MGGERTFAAGANSPLGFLFSDIQVADTRFDLIQGQMVEDRSKNGSNHSVATHSQLHISLQDKDIEGKRMLLFTRMCENARSGAKPDPNLLIASWRDKNLKSLSFFQVFSPIRTLGSYRFFKGTEHTEREGQDERTS